MRQFFTIYAMLVERKLNREILIISLVLRANIRIVRITRGQERSEEMVYRDEWYEILAKRVAEKATPGKSSVNAVSF